MSERLMLEEAERACLGAALMTGNARERVLDLLSEEDFTDDRNVLVYRAMRTLRREGRAIDPLMILGVLRDSGHEEKVGGIVYVAGIDSDLPDLGNLEHYLTALRERTLRRRLIEFSRELAAMAASPEPAWEVLSWARCQLETLEMVSASTDREATSSAVVVESILPELDLGPRNLLGLSTGIRDLDAITLGLSPGHVIVLAGKTGSGKSTLATNIVQRNSIRQQVVTACVSIEMSPPEHVHRMAASESSIEHWKVRKRFYTLAEKEDVRQALYAIRDAPIHFVSIRALDHLSLASRVRRLKLQHGLGLVVVDYLQQVPVAGKFDNRATGVAEVSRSLKILAVELQVPVLALAQLSRKADESNREPQLSDLRECGAIEQDADLVIFIHHDSDSPMTKLIVAKNRAGSTGKCNAFFDREKLTFSDYSLREGAA